MANERIDRRQFVTRMSGGVAAAVTGASFAHAGARIVSGGGMSTGFVYDDRYLEHSLGPTHPESPDRLRTIRAHMDSSGLASRVNWLTDEVGAVDAILAVHSREHFDSVKACIPSGQIAELAVSQVLGAVKAVADGRVRNAFCAIRPPGHHARNNTASFDGSCDGEGFCFLSNVAIAARYAQQHLGLPKVLIIDWDYHFGNGTSFFVKADPSVFFYSTHQYAAYPGTGNPAFIGEGAAVGYTVNVDLGSGTTDTDIVTAWDTVFLPRMQKVGFRPDLVLVSAGFDSRENDTLGTFAVTDAGFVELARRAMTIAEQYCGGRLVSVLEGGYNVDGLGRAVCAHVATLAGLDWRQFVPSGARRRSEGAVRTPEIRHGILYLPDSDASMVERVAVIDASGRELYVVPGAELGRSMIDLWPQAFATAATLVARVELRGREALVVPFSAR